MMREYCIVCGDKIHRGVRSTNLLRRGKNALTCSPKCAKIYYRERYKKKYRKNG